jgi:hypothetical protein
MAKLPDAIRRQRALERTRERFAGRPMELGVSDCAILARAHLKHMGHKNIPAPGNYRSPAQAVKRIRELCAKVGAKGEGLEPLVDALLPRILPSEMLDGDIGMVDREDGPLGVDSGTLVIRVGIKLWAWHPDDPRFALIAPHGMPFRCAWRA